MGNDGAISSLLMGFTQVHVREDSGLCTALSRSISIRMYLGFWAMYRGWKSIKPYDSVEPFIAYLPKCTCWCQSRVKELADKLHTTLVAVCVHVETGLETLVDLIITIPH